MSNFDVIKDSEGKEYLTFDSSELFDDSQMGSKFDDFEVLIKLGEGSFGKVLKVRSKINNKIYAMKKINISEIEKSNQKAYQLTINEVKFLEGLSHPHIIKYYKNFQEGEFLYIIIEYVANGHMEGYISAYKKFNKQIPEEIIWNIFLQCMEGLEYVHYMGVIHRDIKPGNLLMDNNMAIKFGDFGVSALKRNDESYLYKNGEYNPFKNKENMQYHGTYVGTKNYMAKEVLEENEYDQKVDVYSMGVTFFEICYFHLPKIGRKHKDHNNNIIYTFKKIEDPNDANFHYSKELLNIINLMLEEDQNKRKTSKEILDMFKKEYSKRYVKNSSIDSIIRCLYSFNNLTNLFLNDDYQKIKNKPITNAYIRCLQSFLDKHLDIWFKSINNFRQILASENPKLEGTKEIEPRFVFAFLMKELHRELNNPNIKDNKNNYLIIHGEEQSKTSKVEVMLKFINDFNSKVNSIISNNFLGLMKTVKICSGCNNQIYSFSSFFFITLNLETILKKVNIPILNIEEQLFLQNQNIIQNFMYCSKCLNKTKQNCLKQFFSFPNLLVISIQRGITYNYKTPINIKFSLNLNNPALFQYSKKIYNLVGFLGRYINNGNEKFFSVVNIGNKWFNCDGINIKLVDNPLNYHQKGDIIMLFYM